MLEAPGNYGADMAIGEGQGAGNYQSYAGPHYGFLASKAEYTRRLPGRIIGETTDLNGERGGRDDSDAGTGSSGRHG